MNLLRLQFIRALILHSAMVNLGLVSSCPYLCILGKPRLQIAKRGITALEKVNTTDMFFPFAILAAAVAAQTAHLVQVGAGGLRYAPNSITAAVGDSVVFECKAPV